MSLFTTESSLLKHQLASHLREAILNGDLTPGAPIVETQWAPKLGVAQASIREAINILTAEGFVEKQPGRSARVIRLSEVDIADLYRLRAVLEGLAAETSADVTPLEEHLA